ncbi:hypothetical protein LG047_02470 [Methylocystis sp. WRRC1]|uniref:hypothetical protein n=1 Tax=Methylocystis sp. WRRC1 TaxID=1732014 RepID=UPI001D13430C|nr:hypothetical protein [Methylocystis sp. WRRC1]MCC3243759.1 hypothetical protein [Methylocystis sp. WRRC1]MCC3244196.1 hypothetical protein [Methylocystis sp. WRRC1]
MIDDLQDLYGRCRASGFDHEGALTFIEAAIENELRAAVAAVKAGLSEDAPAK